MTTPDRFSVRAFEAERKRHHANIRRAVQIAKGHLDSLAANLDAEPSSLLAYDARQLTVCAAEAWAEAQAFLALHDVRFLTETSDEPAKETGQ